MLFSPHRISVPAPPALRSPALCTCSGMIMRRDLYSPPPHTEDRLSSCCFRSQDAVEYTQFSSDRAALPCCSPHGLVSSIQITVLLERDHSTPSGLLSASAISEGKILSFLWCYSGASRSNCNCQPEARFNRSLTFGALRALYLVFDSVINRIA